MALYKSGWIWLAMSLIGFHTCKAGATPTAGKSGSIPLKSVSATVPNVITIQNSQSTENRPVYVSFTHQWNTDITTQSSQSTDNRQVQVFLTQHLKEGTTGIEGPALDSATYHWSKQTTNTNASDPVSFHANKETKSTNAHDPLSFLGNNETKSTNAPDPLSFHGNNETKSTNAPDLVSFDWNTQTRINGKTNAVSCAIPYRWNKTKTSAEDFLMGFNPGTCRGGNYVTTFRYNRPRVFPCDCESGCETYDTCCADNATDLVTASYTACTRSGWYVLATCPAGWAGNDTIRERCEKGVGGYPDEDLVSDPDSRLAYRNEWCAQCHKVTRFTRWVVEVNCKYYQKVYSALTQRELLLLAQDHPEHCSVGSSPPHGLQPRPCNSRLWPGSSVVGTCNATGQWNAGRYDRDVAANCRRYKALILHVFLRMSESPTVVYRNLFCAICNGVRLAMNVGTDFSKPIGRRPFSLLLGLLDRDVHMGEQADRDCLSGQWLNPKNECQNLSCAAGKVVRKDSCVSVLDEIRGLAYFLNMTLRPSQPLFVSSSNFSVFPAKLKQTVNDKLVHFAVKFQLSMSIDNARYSYSPSLVHVLRVRITGDVYAKRDVRRDDAELSLVRALFHTAWDVVVNNRSVCLVQQNVQDIDSARTTMYMYRLMIMYREDLSVEGDLSFARNLLVPLTSVLTCPFLEFNQSQYDLQPADDRGNNTRLLLTCWGTEVELPDLRKTWLDGGTLYVCYDALKSLRRPARGSAGLDWQYVLTMVMMPLSMLCLLLTLAVYCLLPELRTQPGLNTMCMCISLLVAQLSLLVAAHSQGSTARPWCQVLGAVVHAAWLNVFCWTSICSMHMFRAFSAETYHHRSLSSWRQVTETAGNIGISVLVPSAVTGLVVVVSHLVTNGRSLGYSDVSCYLDNTLVVGLAMVLPASLLLSLNLTLFVLTVRRIHQVTRLRLSLEEAREAQRHVYACARLSLLTGMTWIVSLVAEGLNVDWLQLISILVNGGQGILLLLSHLSTRRIAAMLVVKVGWKGQESSSALQSTNTGLHGGNK